MAQSMHKYDIPQAGALMVCCIEALKKEIKGTWVFFSDSTKYSPY